jgi:hypothetical protein
MLRETDSTTGAVRGRIANMQKETKGGFALVAAGGLAGREAIIWAWNKALDAFGKNVMSANFPWQSLLALGLAIVGAYYIFSSHKRPTWSDKKEPITGKRFRHTVVDIDGKSFLLCDFNGVTLRYKGIAAFDFERCNFSGGVTCDIVGQNIAGVVALIKLSEDLGVPIKVGASSDQA